MPAKPAPARRKRPPPGREPRLERSDWIAAARTALIEGGIERVKVLTLAKALGVTTGSFYWHFADRPQLLSALLSDWEERNTEAFKAAVASTTDPHLQYDRIIEVWATESAFDPAYDSAVRDWARNSDAVEAAVQRIDEQRIELLRQVFAALGQDELEALVRARIAYYHQVGFYAMRVRIAPAERARLVPVYKRLLKGE